MAMLLGLKALGSPGSGVEGTDLSAGSLFLPSQIISQIWPYLSMIMENKFREKLEPKIREKSVHLRTFTFTKLYFGQKVSAVPGRAAWVCCAVSSLSPSSALGHAPDQKDPPGGQPPPVLPSSWASA